MDCSRAATNWTFYDYKVEKFSSGNVSRSVNASKEVAKYNLVKMLDEYTIFILRMVTTDEINGYLLIYVRGGKAILVNE